MSSTFTSLCSQHSGVEVRYLLYNSSRYCFGCQSCRQHYSGTYSFIPIPSDILQQFSLNPFRSRQGSQQQPENCSKGIDQLIGGLQHIKTMIVPSRASEIVKTEPPDGIPEPRTRNPIKWHLGKPLIPQPNNGHMYASVPVPRPPTQLQHNLSTRADREASHPAQQQDSQVEHFSSSKILEGSERSKLITILQKEGIKLRNSRLIYRVSDANPQASQLHDKCDHLSATLVIVRNRFNKFGGLALCSLDEARREPLNPSKSKGLLFSLNDGIVFPSIEDRMLIGYSDRSCISFGRHELLVDYPYGQSYLGISGGSYDITRLPEEKRYGIRGKLGGSKKFQIEMYEVYEVLVKE